MSQSGQQNSPPSSLGNFVITRHPNSSSANQHWKMTEHLKTTQQLVEQFKAAFSGKQPDTAKSNDLLRKIKLELVNFQLVPPFHEEKAIAEAQLTIARQALELAVFYSVVTGDAAGFERHLAQLKPYYFDYARFLKPSEHQWPILGLNLMSLLAANKISDFHTELELIPHQNQESKFIQFPLRLEQQLMEGSYNKVLTAGKDVPLAHYSFFMQVLDGTVREKIAQCSEKAYEFIPLSHGKNLLMLKSDAEAKDFATKRGWKVTQDRIIFPKGQDNSLDIPAHSVVQQTLHYATELERIV